MVPRREWTARLLLSVAAVAIALAAIELGLRRAGEQPRELEVNRYLAGRSWAAPDTQLGWVNRTGVFRSIEAGNVVMTFEADGRRRDPSASRTGLLPTVMVTGGSFAQGYGVADHETFSAVLNRRLAALDVLNYGTGGYSTLQSYHLTGRFLASRGRASKLRAVVYGLIEHHIERNVARADWVRYLTTSDGRMLSPPYARFRDRRLVEHSGGPVPVWPLETRSALVRLAHDGILSFRRGSSEAEALAVTVELVGRMRDLSERHGARYVVAALTEVPNELVRGLVRKGVAVIDCHSPNWSTMPRMRVGGVGHPSARLHAHYAACLERWIRCEIECGFDADCTSSKRSARRCVGEVRRGP